MPSIDGADSRSPGSSQSWNGAGTARTRKTVRDIKLAVRTGEDSFYANVLCRAGVPFGPCLRA